MRIGFPILLVFLLCATAVGANGGSASVFDHPLGKQNRSAFGKVISSLKIKGDLIVDFSQERKVAALERPLVSSGQMFVSQGGVCWMTEKPFRTALLLTGDGVAQKTEGQKKDFKSAKEDRRVQYFVKIMLALFRAEEQVLEKEFDVFFAKKKTEWQIGLKPERRAMAKVLRYITLKGNSDLRRITIVDASGDTTRIDVAKSTRRGLSLKNCVQ